MSRTIWASAAVTGLAAGVVLFFPSAALAAGPPSGEPLACAADDANGVHSCFEKSGDDWWVLDTKKDGASAEVMWSDGTGRSGICTNSNGVNTWKECNEDLKEGVIVTWINYVYDASEHEFKFSSQEYWTENNNAY